VAVFIRQGTLEYWRQPIPKKIIPRRPLRVRTRTIFSRDAIEKAMFLIDEFGTGSDPSGGALAEIFFSGKNSPSGNRIITTHYSNYKFWQQLRTTNTNNNN
jgi:DNA mismatch repair protein MutS2